MKRLDNPDIVPIHRLDRLTAGVVLFSVNPSSRDAYQGLFRQRKVFKCYEALAAALPDQQWPYRYRSRLEPAQEFFRMQEVSGVPIVRRSLMCARSRVICGVIACTHNWA